MKKAFGLLILAICSVSICASTLTNEGYFDSDGVKIRYVVEGEGDPVLLIHGSGGGIQRSWVDRGIYDGLVDAGFRVIAHDQRGYGKSDQPTSPELYGLEMVEDCRRLLDHLGIERAHVVGYSMGGKIAAKFGELHSDRALSLTLGGTGYPFWYPEPASVEQVAKRLRDRGRENDLSPEAMAAVAIAYPDFLPEANALREVDIPTLVIVGRNDMGVPGSGNNRTAGARTLAGMMPNAKLVLVPGNHREASKTPEFLAEISKFLSEHNAN